MKLARMFNGPAPLPRNAAAPEQKPVPAVKAEPVAAIIPGTVVPSAAGLFSPAEANKYSMVQSGLLRLERQLDALDIVSQDTANGCQVGLAEVARALKLVEQTRLEQTKPHRDNVTAINNAWRSVSEGLEKLKRMAERKLLGWNEAERKRLAQEQRDRQEAADKAQREADEAAARAKAEGGTAAEQAAEVAQVLAHTELARAREATAATEEVPRGICTDSGTTSTIWRWTFKVVDEAAVPREFCSLDDRKIRAAIAAGTQQIPGLAIYQEEGLRTITR